MDTLQVRGYADASFANNADNTSQLGMVVVLADANRNACPIQLCVLGRAVVSLVLY